jgi:hypothetical protein
MPIFLGKSGDDFSISADGIAYVTTNAENALMRVTTDENQTLITGGLNSTVVAARLRLLSGEQARIKMLST